MIARIDPIPCSLESILHQSPEGRKGGVDWLISGLIYQHFESDFVKLGGSFQPRQQVPNLNRMPFLEAGQALGIPVKAIARGCDGRFVPAGICWVVERSFAWLSR